MDHRRCAECKGRGYCGLPTCPVMSRFRASLKIRPTDSYMGGAPSVFIGSYGYPKVSGGPLMVDESGTPPEWVAKGYNIDDIVGMRARTIRGTSDISKLEGPVQEIALSQTSLDVEAAFEKPVLFDLRFDGTLTPVGLSGDIKRLDVLDNARTTAMIERVSGDTDLRATEAAGMLYADGVDVYHITKMLTAGLLGVKRHIVPTRWGITAVDEMVTADLRKRIARNQPSGSIQVFCATLYGNTIACILIPGDWKYEMVEIWQKNSLWAKDEDVIVSDMEGDKKSKYSPIAGAYYAARLAVADHLRKEGQSARAVVVRQTSGDYWAPLGSWVVREAARQAMEGRPLLCDTLDEATAAVSGMLSSPKWLIHSRLIPEIRTQRTLFDF